MQRILIAEDEFLVRIGLKTTIDWKSHGYVIVGEASNGKEALQMFIDTDPDIVVTDIKMPIMDGLQLLAEVKQRKPGTQVIILSNHDDFEYARAAMRHGVAQYLLKSEISEAAILAALKSLPSNRTPRQSEDVYQKSPQERYLRRHIHSHLSFDRAQLRATADEQELFPEDHYIALRGDGEVDLNDEFDEDTAVKNMESLLNAAFDHVVCCCSFRGNRLVFTAVYPLRGDPMAELAKCVKKVDTLIRNAKLYFDLDLHIGFSRTASGQPVSALFEQAETARIHCFFTDQKQTMYGDFPAGKKPREFQVDHNYVRELVLSRDQEAVEEYIESVFRELRDLRSYPLLRAAYVVLLSTAKQIRDEQAAGSSQPDGAVSFGYGDLDRMPSLHNVKAYVLDLYRALLEAIGGKEEPYSHTVRRCKEYIEEHYAENLSLDTVARAVGISKSYLSMVFKQEMGINFSVYLTAYRIEQAKQLLTGSNLKIYEIAEKVGFSTPYYFSKVFKEQTGMSCKEYKDTY